MGRVDDAARVIAALAHKLADQERRSRNKMRRGKVCDVDPEKGLYRLELRPAKGEKPAFKSPWLKVAAVAAGGVKMMAEPTIGEWGMLVSESGELADAVITMSGFFDDEKRPHDKNGEFALTVGDGFKQVVDAAGAVTSKSKSQADETEGDVSHEVGGNLVQKAAGALKVAAAGIDFDNGGSPVTFGGGGIVRFT